MSFFKQSIETIIGQNPDRYPLLKLQLIIDWQPIAQYLDQQKGRYARHHGGRPAYSTLSMFKAILLGQWHSLRPLQNSLKNHSTKNRRHSRAGGNPFLNMANY